MVNYNTKRYYIDVVEAKPSRAISIVDTDCEVDFAPPLDYVEPERPPPAPVAAPIQKAPSFKANSSKEGKHTRVYNCTR
eukprot:8733836-Pyramimonas_sp.AAC.2